MPGFLSGYSEVTTLTFGAGNEWWIRVRKYLLRGDFKAAQAKLISPVMKYVDEASETSGRIDTGGYHNELVARGLVEWNLTDEAGVLIPLGQVTADGPDAVRYRAVDMLPEEVFDKVLGAINGAAPKKKADVEADKAADPFPASREAGAVGQGTGAAGTEQV